MTKKHKFGHDFGPFGPKWRPQIFLREFYLYEYLGIVPSYHSVQFKGKLLNQTLDNGKKTNFGPNFGQSDPNLGP